SPKFAQPGWLPGTLVSSLAIVLAWSGFLASGSISTIWPMFGTANQLLASIALFVGTTGLINGGKAPYARVPVLPGPVVGTTALTAAVLNITNTFGPMTKSADSAKAVQGWLNSGLTVVIIACAVTVFVSSMIRWWRTLYPTSPAARAVPAE